MCLFRCSKLLVNKDDVYNSKYFHEKPNKQRWKENNTMSVKSSTLWSRIIDGCGCLQPSYKLEGMDGIKAVWKKLMMKVEQYLKVEQVKEIFEKITDEDCKYMGAKKVVV